MQNVVEFVGVLRAKPIVVVFQGTAAKGVAENAGNAVPNWIPAPRLRVDEDAFADFSVVAFKNARFKRLKIVGIEQKIEQSQIHKSGKTAQCSFRKG